MNDNARRAEVREDEGPFLARREDAVLMAPNGMQAVVVRRDREENTESIAVWVKDGDRWIERTVMRPG